MSDLLLTTVLAASVIASFLIGPGVSILFLLIRKKRRRARRRSPIGIDLLRTPGHSLREQLDEATSNLTWDILLIGVMPVAFLAIFLAQGHVVGLARMARLAPVYVLATALLIAWMVKKMLKAGDSLDRLRTGFDAELAVGQELDLLMKTGASVFHDFPGENFNIDHIVVSGKGVFAIETKGYTKPTDRPGRKAATVTYDGHVLKFPDWTTKEPIEQAERQAKWLARWISSAAGEQVRVSPVLALPGWFVKQEGRSAVRVFSGRALSSLLKGFGAAVLSPESQASINHQLDLRCRTVVPTYRRDSQAK